MQIFVRSFAIRFFWSRRPMLLALVAGLIGMMTVSPVSAQEARPVERVEEPPGYATNAAFFKTNDCDPTLFYLTVGLEFTEVLGKTIIVGTFFEIEVPAGPTGVAFLPTEAPNEFWFLTGNSLYGLITIQEDLSIDWVDGQGNRGFIILY